MTNRPNTQLTPKTIVAKQRRLDELLEQQAVLGINTPAHVNIEIEDIQAELALADVLERPAYSPELRAKLQTFDPIELLGKFIGTHATQLANIAQWQTDRDKALEVDNAKRSVRENKVDFVFGTLIGVTALNLILLIIVLVNVLGR